MDNSEIANSATLLQINMEVETGRFVRLLSSSRGSMNSHVGLGVSYIGLFGSPVVDSCHCFGLGFLEQT